jgi:hypothetical protein
MALEPCRNPRVLLDARCPEIATAEGQASLGDSTDAIPIARAGGPRLSSMRFFPQSPRSRTAGNVRAVAVATHNDERPDAQ